MIPTRRRLLSFFITITLTAVFVRHFMSAQPRTIVIGGGLAGLSAAHTLLENGATVLLLDKKPS